MNTPPSPLTNPITLFFLEHIVEVFFVYGLAFFIMGVVLGLASRRKSELPIVRALPLLALFGFLHGAHEWMEMFQDIAARTRGHTPGLWEEAARTGLLALSFLFLLAFGVRALYAGADAPAAQRRRYGLLLAPVVAWAAALVLAVVLLQPSRLEAVYFADVLSRYLIAIPGALVGAWALLRQQRSFRERGGAEFGRDLVSAATALLLYGVVGQIFVRETAIVPSTVLNNGTFLAWFGIPVQLYRAVMAAVFLLFMTRALRVLEAEERRRIEEAARNRIEAQERVLEFERSASREQERLNQALAAKAKELALLLDLSNMLSTPLQSVALAGNGADTFGATRTRVVPEQLETVLQRIVQSLSFSDAGLVLRVDSQSDEVRVEAAIGFATTDTRVPGARFGPSVALGRHCIAAGRAVCRHADGVVIEFSAGAVLLGEECWSYLSPTVALALPLTAQRVVIGAVVFARAKSAGRPLAIEELTLMVGIARQLELSMENARLYRQAQEREETLEHVLYQVVGAQEAERQRIARELHDATGQSLSAIALGLRGLANKAASLPAMPPAQVRQAESLTSFATDALGELRRIIADLRPPQLDDLGLAAAVRWYVQTFRQRHPQIQITFTLAGDQTPLPKTYETVIFRVVQEALTNIAKHAHATKAAVVLEMKQNEVVVTVQDNGLGFDTAQALSRRGQSSSWGLLGIRERTLLLNGHYEIKSAPGQGTLIRIRVPAVRPRAAEPVEPVEPAEAPGAAVETPAG